MGSRHGDDDALRKQPGELGPRFRYARQGIGILSMMVELETDSVLAGPKGRVTASISDAAHNLLYRVTSDEIGIGGKPPGQVVIKNFSSTISIPAAITAAAASFTWMQNAQGQSIGCSMLIW